MATHGSGGTRERILDAAATVMRHRGLARATTKEIARAAELSEAALYKHFASKENLLLAVLRHRMPEFIEPLNQLPARVGEGTVAAHLEEIARQALPYYEQVMGLVSALFSEPELQIRYREELADRGMGPHLAIEALARYLLAEQRIGRLAAGASPHAAAALLLGACYQRAFHTAFMGSTALDSTHEQFASDIVRTLLGGIATDTQPSAMLPTGRGLNCLRDPAAAKASSANGTDDRAP